MTIFFWRGGGWGGDSGFQERAVVATFLRAADERARSGTQLVVTASRNPEDVRVFTGGRGKFSREPLGFRLIRRRLKTEQKPGQ